MWATVVLLTATLHKPLANTFKANADHDAMQGTNRR